MSPDWSQALCTRTRQPERGYWTSDSLAERELARQACFQCPIRQQCADWAVRTLTHDNHHPDLTIWGGMNATERHRRRTAWLAERRAERHWRAEAG